MRNNKFIITALEWNGELELPRRWYIIKNQETITNNLSIQIYIKKMKIELYSKLRLDDF